MILNGQRKFKYGPDGETIIETRRDGIEVVAFQKYSMLKHTRPGWKEGDAIQCVLDKDNRVITSFVNIHDPTRTQP